MRYRAKDLVDRHRAIGWARLAGEIPRGADTYCSAARETELYKFGIEGLDVIFWDSREELRLEMMEESSQ